MFLVYLFFTTFLFLVFLAALNYFLIDLNTTLDSVNESSTSYECGFEHNSLSRIPFSIRYFLLTLVFLIFDVEIMLLSFVPSFLLVSFSPMTIIIVILFLILLFLGLVYEWYDGSLDWVI